MQQHSTYQDLSNMLSENKADMDAVDFIELCTELYELINKLREQAQEEINQSVEQLVDSFGGENCTMRDLKGDL